MTDHDRQQWATRLESLGKTLPSLSPEEALQQLTTLLGQLSLSTIEGATFPSEENNVAVVNAILGVSQFNRSGSPIKLELWGCYHGKRFLVQGERQ